MIDNTFEGWQTTTALSGSQKLADLLADGWEPFSSTRVLSRGADSTNQIDLRKFGTWAKPALVPKKRGGFHRFLFA